MNARTELRKFIEESQETPESVASKAGIGRSVVYKFLNGRDIRLSSWEKISRVMAVHSDSFQRQNIHE
jgi:predicted transcriptional regulator